METGRLSIEVVFALPQRQSLITVTVPEGSCVEDAIVAAGMYQRFAQEPLATYPSGIWGRVVARDHPVRDGDRVELYRPLAMDPRDARRRRATGQ